MKIKMSPGHEILSNKDESVPLFKSGLLDVFTRVSWWVPPLIFLPVIGYFGYISFSTYGFSITKLLGLLLAGLLIWTITEYLFHRFIFHHYPNSSFGRKIHFMMHGVHHAYPNDTMRLVMPPLMSVPLSIGFYFLWALIFKDNVAPIYTGFMLGYLTYDMMHYATHHAKFIKSKWFVHVKNHHMKHHYQDPDHGFGVSSTIWDKVFKTEIK